MVTARELADRRNELTASYYEWLKNARSNGTPVAYITGWVPAQEILYAMDVIPAYPENYGLLICSQGFSDDLCQAMEEKGYSPELCGYSKASIGAMFKDQGPFGGPPKPDLLISSPNMCGSHPVWWEVTSRYYKVPHFIVDAPHTACPPQRHHLDYFISQIKDMIAFLEQELGRKLSQEKLMEAVNLSEQACRYYSEILDLMKTRPSPLSFRDLCGHLFPICVLSGTQTAVDFYKDLRDFVKEKADNKIGCVPKEKYRLAWDNLPVWHDLRLLNYIEEQNASIVFSPYVSQTWGKGRLDPDNILETMAEKYLTGWVKRLVDDQIDLYRQAVREYSLDGIVFFANRGCRPFTTGQYDVARRLRQEGIPSLIIDGNMADSRGYSKSETRRMVDEFFELLG